MHRSHALSALTAVALSVSVAGPATAAATPAPTTDGFHATASARGTQAAARLISLEFEATNDGQRFTLFGGIRPLKECVSEVEVRLNHRRTQQDEWRIFARTTTSLHGRYAFTGLNTAGFFRTVAPASEGCERAVSRTLHVTRG